MCVLSSLFLTRKIKFNFQPSFWCKSSTFSSMGHKLLGTEHLKEMQLFHLQITWIWGQILQLVTLQSKKNWLILVSFLRKSN
jgi:hypothetical protein